MKVSILHEGKSIDKDFYKLFYAHLGITEEELDKRVNFIGMGSKSNFFNLDNKNYKLLKKEIKREFIEKVLFIVDSDYKGDKKYDGYDDTIKEIKNIQQKLNIQDISDTFIAYDMNSEKKEGYLESLILSTLSNEQDDCINSFLEKCPEFRGKNSHKSIFNVIYKNAYPKAPYNFEHYNFAKLKRKLQKLYEERKMTILPAIDLKDGKAVRLSKGLMESAKIYSDEPWQVAKRFEELGSEWVHLVDLNGAFAGEPKNLEQIRKIRENCNLKLELGGGIRDEETIKMYLELGIDRLILGSIAVKDPQFVRDMASKYPIVVGIDAIDGMVAVEGWAETSNMKATDLAREFASCGVEAIICTDVGRDGMMTGVNVDFTLEIAKASGVETIASGGLKDIDDIKRLIEAKCDGTIVGKAFYEGTLDLEEAFSLAKKEEM